MCVCSIHMCLVKGPGPPWQPPYWNWALKTTSEWSAKGNSKAPPPGPLTPNGYCNRHAMVTVRPHGQTSDCEIPAPTQNSGRNNLMVTAHLDCSMLLRVTECLKPRWHFANAPSLYARRMTTAKTVHRRTIAWQHHVQQVGNTVRVQIGDIVQLVNLDSSVKNLEHVIGVQVHMIHVTLTLAK